MLVGLGVQRGADASWRGQVAIKEAVIAVVQVLMPGQAGTVLAVGPVVA